MLRTDAPAYTYDCNICANFIVEKGGKPVRKRSPFEEPPCKICEKGDQTWTPLLITVEAEMYLGQILSFGAVPDWATLFRTIEPKLYFGIRILYEETIFKGQEEASQGITELDGRDQSKKNGSWQEQFEKSSSLSRPRDKVK